MTNIIKEVQLKRGPSSNVVSASLKRGEPALALDKKELWVGDGLGKVKITDTYFYNSVSNFSVTGEENKLYIAKDTGSFYIWDGSDYKKYEFDIDTSIVQCRIRSNTQAVFPAAYQDLILPIVDSVSEPTKLHHDEAKLVFDESGWFCVKSKVNFSLPSPTGGYTTINGTSSSRVLKNSVSAILDSYDTNKTDLYFCHTEITDTLSSDFIEWFNAGEYITLQIQGEGNLSYVQSAKLEAYKISIIKGDKGDPGPSGSRWYAGVGIPTITLGENNDYYLDTDTKDVYVKNNDAWSLITNIAGGPPGPTGPAGSGMDELNNITSDSLQQTTNNQFQEKVRLDLTGLIGGKYRIGFYFEWNYNDGKNDFKGRVRIDDTLNIMELQSEPKDTGSDQFYPISGFDYQTLSAGDHHITIDWCCSKLGNRASIRRARLEIWKV